MKDSKMPKSCSTAPRRTVHMHRSIRLFFSSSTSRKHGVQDMASVVAFHRCETFRRIVDAVRELVDHANLEFSTDGLSFQAVDVANVALVTGRIERGGFATYGVEKSVVAGVHLGHLSKILACGSSDSALTLRLKDGSMDICIGHEGDDRHLSFSVRLVDIECAAMDIPEAVAHGSFTISSTDLHRHLRDFSTIGEIVTIRCRPKRIDLSVSGDTGRATVTFLDGGKGHVRVESSDDVCGTFALRYMCSFGKASPLSPAARVSVTRGMPLMVEYPIGNFGYVRFYLSPKIEDDAEW